MKRPSSHELFVLFLTLAALGVIVCLGVSAAHGQVSVGQVPEETKLKVMPELPVEVRAIGTNFGVDRSKISTKPRYCINGKEVTRSQAIRAASEPIPDDENRFRLVLVGSESDTTRVLTDTTRVIGDRVIVQAYTPDCPLVKQRGWSAQGSPAISLLSPTGKVIARNTSGKYPGKEETIQAVNRLVNAYDTSKEGAKTGVYDPSKDKDLFEQPRPVPDPNKPGPDGGKPFSPEQIPWWAWLAGGVAVMLLLRKDK